ncbi:XdhC family protein [Hyphomicrobium sp.]|uniref:XdhC family protein n=1 Tax=Hyphomicrobium sp. TaxID=82 RepID=UPI0025BF99C9|nr:XdhC family protein [Hyphomicrobium sp.]MCC7250794.1 XdhC family protein [Hyphomicrobium sp.]
MNEIPQRLPVAAPAADLLAEDDVLATLCKWHQEGLRTALVTLVGVEGAAPRPIGAQMVVAEDGRYIGYLSGGCLEQAIVLEARDVMDEGRNRLVRYGKGSRYIDIRLPCGSGLDIFFDCSLGGEQMAAIAGHLSARRRFAIRSTLTGADTFIESLAEEGALFPSVREGDLFLRVVPPRMRLLLVGSSPVVAALAALARITGIETELGSLDDAARANSRNAGVSFDAEHGQGCDAIARLDCSSAVVLASHEHEIEPAIIARLLQRDCFYIGVLGSRTVHEQRLRALAAMGIDDASLARLRAPVGLIQGAKSKATLAVGVLAEMLAEAKARNLVS